MQVRGSRLFTICVWCSMLCVGLGCGSKVVGRTSLGTKIGNREVKASMDGGGFITGQSGQDGQYGTATITTSVGKLVVEKDRVLLNGKELAELSADAKLVEVDITAGKLTLKADGAEILTKDPGK